MNNLELTIVAVSKLQLSPADVLVIRVPDDIPEEVLSEVYGQFSKVIPAGVKIVVLPKSTELTVLSAAEEASKEIVAH